MSKKTDHGQKEKNKTKRKVNNCGHNTTKHGELRTEKILKNHQKSSEG